MILSKKNIFILLSLIAIFTGCAKVEYTNPLDPKCPNYVGPDSAGDVDPKNGIADMYDPTSPFYKTDKDTPFIEILGDNPKTLSYKASRRSEFDAAIEKLKGEIRCWDNSDKTVDKSDVVVTHNINYTAGEYTMNYSVSDSSNNYRKVTRTVIVELLPEDDTIPPSISPSNFYVTNDTANIDKGTVLSDSAFMTYLNIYDSDGSKFEMGKNVKKEGDVNTGKVSVYKVKFTATDKSGNDSSYSIYFNVVDKEVQSTDAVLTVSYNNKDMNHGDKIIDTLPDINFSYDLFKWDAYEFVNNEKVDLKDKVDHPCDYVANKDGNYTAEFYVIGSNGIEKRINIYIVILPKGGEKPLCDTTIEMKLIGSDTVRLFVDQEYEEKGITAFRYPGNVDVSNKVSKSPQTVNTAVAATIPVVYSIRNSCGTTSITRIVIVQSINDNEGPKIYLKKNRMVDTVAEGTKYANLKYKSLTDVIDSIVDNIDGRINISGTKVSIDSSGFKTGEAGKPCSLVYSAKDANGNIGKAVRKFIVVDASTFGLLEKYGVPASAPLANLSSMTFSKVTVEGMGGPTFTSATLKINFKNDQWGDLWEFGIDVKTSTSTKNYNLLQNVKQTFKQPQPGMTLTNTGITNLDNEYYVIYTDSKFVWVEKSGNFAIVWAE